MHQTLCIPELLLNIFRHCFMESPSGGRSSVNLVVLARTCQTFKEPALDMLWEELFHVTPLLRCLPEACRLVDPKERPLHSRRDGFQQPCYVFSRPLKEVEWNTLRGYTSRVRSVHVRSYLDEDAVREIFSLTPFDDPLFPHLRSLYWAGKATFIPLHVAVPSLTLLCFSSDPSSHHMRRLTEKFLDAFVDRCPHLEKLEIHSSHLDPIISRVVWRWPRLQEIVCPNVVLNTDAISCLSSVSHLKRLEFTTEISTIQGISHLDSKLVFSSLTNLNIRSFPLYIITSLLRCIRLPAIETLFVDTAGYTSKRVIREYLAAVREACSINVLTCFQLWGSIGQWGEEGAPLDEELLPCITLEDLRPCTVFTELRELYVDFDCPICLTDADLLELVTPRMENFLVNCDRGWGIYVDGGGITFSGLVQLLQQRPLLERLCIAIETRTFTKIPEELDVSFLQQRQLKIDLSDSFILPGFVPGLVSVFTMLGMDPSMLTAWEPELECEHHGAKRFQSLWQQVFGALRSAS